MKKAEASGSCPQCGGPVDLDIGDPLLSCSFCRTKLYMVPPAGVFSYFLTPVRKPHKGHKACLIPYWRFRGFKFRVHAEKATECSLIDSTLPAADILAGLPLLGMAPQLGTIRLNPTLPPGLHLLNNPKKALKRADARIEALLGDKPVMEGIMGENSSLIYAPFEVIEHEGDETSIRPLWGAEGVISLDSRQKQAVEIFMKPLDKKKRIRFLPLICPECGGDLPAFPRATALLCRFCGRIWGLGTSRLFPKRFFTAADSIHKDMLFMPFWHFNIKTQGLDIASRYEFFRLLFPYRDAPESWKKEPVQILIPAFKINPSLFCRLSTRMSKTAIELPEGTGDDSRVIPALHMVNLALEEAAHSIRITLFELFRHKRRMRERLRNTVVKVKGSRLVLLRFKKGRREYIEIHSGLAIPVAALELGTRL